MRLCLSIRDSFVIFCAALTLVGCGNRAANEKTPEEIPQPEYGQEESNVELWLETMELGSREIYAARNEVVKAVGLKPGDRVADIGAGTGLHTLLFAEKVGADGAVFAVDIEPKFLKLINQRSADNDYSNVTAVLGRDNSITLPENEVDVVFISDTYNYFEDPEAIIKSVYTALRPNGYLIVLDFDIVEGVERTPDNQHIRIGKEAVASEIERVGFVLDQEVDVPGLEATYMLRFQRQ